MDCSFFCELKLGPGLYQLNVMWTHNLALLRQKRGLIKEEEEKKCQGKKLWPSFLTWSQLNYQKAQVQQQAKQLKDDFWFGYNLDQSDHIIWKLTFLTVFSSSSLIIKPSLFCPSKAKLCELTDLSYSQTRSHSSVALLVVELVLSNNWVCFLASLHQL